MTGKEWDISDQELVEILRKEFVLEVDDRCTKELKRARMSLVIYKDMEEFLEQTHWQQDNPELADENYLTKNRICRWIYGRFVYFSWLLWESEVLYERGREKGWIADESVR